MTTRPTTPLNADRPPDDPQAQGTTANRAAALGMTPAEYRAHSHAQAVERVRAAAQGLHADAGIRVIAALDGARACDEPNPESGDPCNRHHGHFGFHRHVMATGVYTSWVGDETGAASTYRAVVLREAADVLDTLPAEATVFDQAEHKYKGGAAAEKLRRMASEQPERSDG